MPLELHATDGRGAGRKPPLLVLEEVVHSELFAELNGLPEVFPLLTRLADYYGDAYYRSDELADLAAERERAARRFTGPCAQQVLEKLREVAKDLARRGQKLYAVAD